MLIKLNMGKKELSSVDLVDEKINNIKQKLFAQSLSIGGRTVYAKKNGNYYDVTITNSEGKIISTVGGKIPNR